MVDVILVSGDRFAAYDTWAPLIRSQFSRFKPLVLIHGDAKGIDTIAKQVAEQNTLIGIEAYPAEWDKWEKLGKRNFAGRARNQEMLDRLLEYRDYGRSVVVLGFHPTIDESKGTKHMLDIARRAEVTTIHFDTP